MARGRSARRGPDQVAAPGPVRSATETPHETRTQTFRFMDHVQTGTEDQRGSGRPQLDSATFERFQELIHEISGIHFPAKKKYLLESRVRRRLRKLNLTDFTDYCEHLEDAGADEVGPLISAITINETSFFRHGPRARVLEEELIPRLVEARSDSSLPRLRLWSAACATGEEAYTLAMILRETVGGRLPVDRLRVCATDIDQTALRKAREGVYPKRVIEGIPSRYRTRYVRETAGSYRVIDSVRDMVRFEQINLRRPEEVRRVSGCDLILCANVLIYFGSQVRRKTVHSLARRLRPGGYLLVGFSENLREVDVDLEPVRMGQITAYRKTD